MSSAGEFFLPSTFLLEEWINYPDGCDGIKRHWALITDYFNEGQSDDESGDEINLRNEGKLIKIKVNKH